MFPKHAKSPRSIHWQCRPFFPLIFPPYRLSGGNRLYPLTRVPVLLVASIKYNDLAKALHRILRTRTFVSRSKMESSCTFGGLPYTSRRYSAWYSYLFLCRQEGLASRARSPHPFTTSGSPVTSIPLGMWSHCWSRSSRPVVEHPTQRRGNAAKACSVGKVSMPSIVCLFVPR